MGNGTGNGEPQEASSGHSSRHLAVLAEEAGQRAGGMVAAMTVEQHPHDRLIGRLEDANWEIVGRREDHYVRYSTPAAPPWVPSIIVPIAPDASDYDDLLAAAESVIAQIHALSTSFLPAMEREAGGNRPS